MERKTNTMNNGKYTSSSNSSNISNSNANSNKKRESTTLKLDEQLPFAVDTLQSHSDFLDLSNVSFEGEEEEKYCTPHYPQEDTTFLVGEFQSPNNPRVVKSVRVNVHTLNQLLETHLDIYNLPQWTKINRIVFQAAGINEDGIMDLYPRLNKTVLRSPLIYLEILFELRRRYNIQIYLGMPLVYSSENLGNNSQHSIPYFVEYEPEKFWTSLAALIHQYGFNGSEINLEGLEHIPPNFCEYVMNFMYRGSLVLTFKNNYCFIHHHGKILKGISELIESLVINSYGYFKYMPIDNELSKMLPRCECSVEDWLNSYVAYREYDIPSTKIMLGMETSAVIYFLDSSNFNEVDCISFTPVKVVEQLRREGERVNDSVSDYTEYFDREKKGCVLECPERGVTISYENLRMSVLKLQLCRDKQMRGCVLGNIIDDVPITHEHNLIYLMNKYI